MLNLPELEKRWLRYKIKSYIPLVSIMFTSILAILIIYFISNSKNIKKEEITQTINEVVIISPKKELNNSQVPLVIKQKQNFQVKTHTEKFLPTQTVTTKKATKVKLSPSLDFMKRMQNSVQPYYKNEHQDISKKVTIPVVIDTEHKEVHIEKKETRSNISTINIERRNTQNDIYEIIKRFKKNNNPALSLFIAKKYYELGNYKQAYNYSLITNEINKDIESSWIVFAKSLVKLKKEKKALSTLREYINYSHSSSAKILYDEIRSGKFR